MQICDLCFTEMGARTGIEEEAYEFDVMFIMQVQDTFAYFIISSVLSNAGRIILAIFITS